MVTQKRQRLVIGVVLCILYIAATPLFAQNRLSGRVLSRSSKQPLGAAVVTGVKGGTLTAADGRFTLWQWRRGDTLTVSCIGYQTYKHVLMAGNNTDTLRIYLQPASVLLRAVTVQGQQLYRADSLRTRREFSDVFGYQALTPADAILQRANLSYKPYDQITALNNTTQISGIDVIRALALLGGHKKSMTKLQQTLQQDEDAAYADRRFSVRRVAAVTSLRGDSLKTFISTYRPDADQLKTQTDYEVLMYIKRSYDAFKQGKIKVKNATVSSLR